MAILPLLFHRVGLEPADMAGATLSGEIPLSDAALNRLLASRLADHPHVSALRVTAREGDELLVRIEPRIRFLPSLNLLVRIERQPQLPDRPTLQLRWHIPGTGPMALLAGRLASLLKATPQGVSVDGDLVTVDLAALLRQRGLEDVLTLIRRMAVHTRTGAVRLEVEMTM